MEFKPHLFKSWFNVEEIHRLLKNNYKLEYSPKDIIKSLSKYPHIVEILFYAEYYGETNQLILGKQEQPFGKLEIKKNPRFPDEYLTRYFDTLSTRSETTYTADHSELIVKLIDNKPIIQLYKGLLFVPDFCLSESMLAITDEHTLILPETAFYDPFDFFIERTKSLFSLKFRPDYLFMRFNGSIEQGMLNIADLRIHADDFSYIANIFEYESQRQEEDENAEADEEQPNTPQPPKTEKTIKTVKNKSNEKSENRTPRNKKDFFTPLILASIHATAQAYPHLGGYQIVNAVLDTLKDKQGFKTSDLYTVEGYLGKYKRTYNATFPRNSGRHKAQITAIITEPTD
ncbi:hypothetical protein MY791_05490 [Haemophilus influenzae]|nr:hypothetical protein [Haemophilus influenzae]